MRSVFCLFDKLLFWVTKVFGLIDFCLFLIVDGYSFTYLPIQYYDPPLLSIAKKPLCNNGTKLSILKQKMQKQRLLLPQASFPQGAPYHIRTPQGAPICSHRECPSLPCFHMANSFLSFPPRPQGAPVPTSFPHVGSTCAVSFSTDSTRAL